MARAPDATAPGRTLAPHTIPLANLPFALAPEGIVRKSAALAAMRRATEPTKCPLCEDKFYNSGAMMEQLAWPAVHAAAPDEDKKGANHILQGKVRQSPWQHPYAKRGLPPRAPR